MADRLVPTNAKSVIVASSPPDSLAEIAKGLDLAASIFSKDLTATEVEFWKQKFGHYKPQHITRAFAQHCEDEEFFPRPRDIKQLIGGYLADEAPGPAEKLREQMKLTSRQITE